MIKINFFNENIVQDRDRDRDNRCCFSWDERCCCWRIHECRDDRDDRRNMNRDDESNDNRRNEVWNRNDDQNDNNCGCNRRERRNERRNWTNPDWNNNGQGERFEQHDHEFTSSVRIAERNEDPHNHRFAGVSSLARPSGRSHVHDILVRTDSLDHTHIIRDVTSEAIDVGNGRHVHNVRGFTTVDDGHRHSYFFATLIENPIGERMNNRD